MRTLSTTTGESRARLDVSREGRLEGTSVPEIFCRVARERASGSLVVERGSLRKVVYLREGRVIFAASTDPEDRLGHFLVRRGEVRLTSLVEAGCQVAEGRRLGQTLIEQGAMEPPAVVRAVTDQIREIVLSIFPWRDGAWRLSPARLPDDESITLDISTEDLILAGVRRVEDWRRVRRAVGGPRAIYRVRPGVATSRDGFGMIERAVMERLGTPQRIDTLCREVYAPSFAIYRAVWGLHILGYLERWDPHPVQECLAEPGEGFIREDGLADLLLDLGDRGFTGVLRVFREEEEGSLFLEGGRVQFATTSDPEQGLSGHLLRRGVISERDHELAVRRLISGKRLGRILAEDGVIDDADVERFVREQVLDVARRLVLWTSGEYLVEEGLPSNEEVKLGLWAEDVVMTAYETIDRFRPVWESLGGLDSLYRLRPEYLDRLDRMSLRPEAWSLVALLGRPRRVGEVLDARSEPDFDMCRLLCALERARVIERVPVEERDHAPGDEVFSAQTGEPHDLARDPVDEAAEREPAAARAKSAAEIAPELFTRAASAPAFTPPDFSAYGDEPDDGIEGAIESVAQIASPPPMDDSPRHEAPARDTLQDEISAAFAPLRVVEPRSAEHGEALESESADDAHAVNASEDETSSDERRPWIRPRVEAVYRDDEGVVAAFPDTACGEPSEPVEGVVREDLPPLVAAPEAGIAESDRDDEPTAPADVTPVLGVPALASTPSDAVAPTLLSDAPAPPSSEPDASASDEDSGWIPALDEPGAHTEELAAAQAAVSEMEDADTGYELGEPGTGVAPLTSGEEPNRTLELPRAQAVPTAEPSEALLAEIDRFNVRHGLLYRELQIQVGAGVANFVRACQRSLGSASALFEGLTPDARGSFDRDALAGRLTTHAWVQPPRALLDALIDEELATVRHLLDRHQVDAIERKLAIEAP